MRASVVEANVLYRPTLPWLGRLSTALSVGVAQAGVIDYWISDTPREEMQIRARGFTGAVVADVRIVRKVSVLVRASTQRLTADRGRVGAAFNLDASTVGAGLRLWL